MKRVFALATALLLGSMVFAQGVDFQNLTYKEALEKAKAENKLVFMDCYTSWCGPCKIMMNKVFPQKEAGDYFNPLFVCVKFDMEKGEGIELAKEFGIHAYPTFVILNSDGVVLQKLVGGGEVNDFIERVKKALEDTQVIDEMEAKYNKGYRDKAFLAQYVNLLLNVSASRAEEAALELFQELSDEEKFSEKYWFLFSNDQLAPLGSELTHFLLENRDKFVESVGSENIDQYIIRLLNARLFSIQLGTYEVADAETVKQINMALDIPTISNFMSDNAELAKVILIGDPEKLLKYYERAVKDASKMNIPFEIIYAQKAKATPAQIERWIKVLQAAKEKCKHQQDTLNIDKILEFMKE